MPQAQTQSGGPFGDTAYDPSSATPYQAPKLPDITPPPPRDRADTAPPAPPTMIGGKGAGVAKVATILDNVLRGVMRGREQAQQINYYKAKKLSDGLQYSYENDAQKYLALAQGEAGTKYAEYKKLQEMGARTPALAVGDPVAAARLKELSTDKDVIEIQKADSAQRASYQTLMQMRGNYIMGADGKPKKSKGGKNTDQDQDDPTALMASKDPKDKMRGAFMMQQKLFQKYGTPANTAAIQYMSPEYQAQRKLYQGQQQVSTDIQAKQLELHKLQNADPKTLNDDQKRRLDQLQNDIELFPALAHQVPHYATIDTPGSALAGKTDPRTGMPIVDKFGSPINPKMNYRQETVGGETYWIPSVKKGLESHPGTVGAFFQAVADESDIPVDELSSKSQLELQRAWQEGKEIGKVVSQNYIYTDKATGKIVVVPLTRTTAAGKIEVPSVSASGGGAGAGTGASAPAGSTANKSKPHVRDLPAPGTKSSTTTDATGTGTGTDTDNTLPPGSPKGARVIGHTLSQPQAKAQQTTNDTYKKMKPLFGLLAAQEDYMKEIKADHSKASPRQDLSLVVAAVRAMNPGSVRLPAKELELEIKAGSWGDQAARWYDKASTGLLPDDQRDDLFSIVKRETTKAGESIAADWQQSMSGQPLPSDIKRFAKSGGTSSGSDAPIPPSLKNKMDADFGAAPTTPSPNTPPQ
jgi:hypothetical protein